MKKFSQYIQGRNVLLKKNKEYSTWTREPTCKMSS